MEYSIYPKQLTADKRRFRPDNSKHYSANKAMFRQAEPTFGICVYRRASAVN
jgi:hypothetical protein